MYYLDTSVLTPYYCPEPLSAPVEEIITATDNPTISHLTQVELYSAISRKVREGLAVATANKIIRQFEYHAHELKIFRQLTVDQHHYTMAANWISQLNTPLRTLDGLHLAITATANLTLLTADKKLAVAAHSFGIEATLLC